MKKEKNFPLCRDYVIAIASIFLGIFFVSYALFGGFNFGLTVFNFILLISGTIYLKRKGKKIGFFGICLLILSFIGSFSFSFTSGSSTNLILIFTIFISIFSYFYIVNYGSKSIGDLKLPILVLRSCVVTPFEKLTESLKEITPKNIKNASRYKKLGVGAACALPVLLIVVPLLISSDAAFEALTAKIFNGLFTSLLKIILGIIVAPVIFSYFFANRNLVKKIKIKNNLNNYKIDSLYGVSFLFVISICYVAYLLSQLAYLFGGMGGFLPVEFTMAEYARRGFFEITAISIINFIIIGCASIFCKKEKGIKTSLLGGFISFIGCFTMLLITTAIAKMVMYIDRFGMTKMRIQTSLFLVFIFVLCLLLTIRCVYRKAMIIRPALITALIIVISIGTVGTNRIIADYNTNAYLSGELKSVDIQTISYCDYSSIKNLIKLEKHFSDVSIYEDNIDNYDDVVNELINKFDEMYTLNEKDKPIRSKEQKIENFNLEKETAYKEFDEYIENNSEFIKKVIWYHNSEFGYYSHADFLEFKEGGYNLDLLYEDCSEDYIENLEY